MALLRTFFNSGRSVISRNIRMSANMKEKAAEKMEKLKEENPYFSKYADKLAKAQNDSPEEFLAKLHKQEEENKRKAAKEKERSYSELMNPKKPVEKKAEIPVKRLEDIMKLNLLEDKTSEELATIWLEYHKQKEVIAAAIPTPIYNTMIENAKKYPIFLFPIPRSQGFEFIMLQFAVNSVYFTPLLCYQVHKENAPECLNMVHYTEFKDQGVVLMRGEYDSKVLTATEARCLANQLQLYYTMNEPNKVKLLDAFTKTPENFKHMDVIKELENIQLV